MNRLSPSRRSPRRRGFASVARSALASSARTSHHDSRAANTRPRVAYFCARSASDMSFERIDFSYLFHDGFRLDRKALILHLAIENRIHELAERAVLSALLSGSGERPDPSAIPVLDDDAVQDAFYQLQVRLDCYDAEQAERMVGGCGTDLEEVHAALHRALVRRRIASALVRRAVAGEGDAQTAICWEAFTAGALRGDA